MFVGEYSFKNTVALFVRIELIDWLWSKVALFGTTKVHYSHLYANVPLRIRDANHTWSAPLKINAFTFAVSSTTILILPPFSMGFTHRDAIFSFKNRPHLGCRCPRSSVTMTEKLGVVAIQLKCMHRKK